MSEDIDKLLNGFIEQVKVGSRTWITLAVLSIYSISVSELNPDKEAKLPFIDVTLSKEWFTLIAIGIMAALISRWLEAQSRAINTRRNLVEPLLSHLSEWQNQGPSPKEMWDARVFPGTATVWSAPASLLESKNKFIKWLAAPYLIFLKILAISVHFGLPGVAIALMFMNWDYTDKSYMANIVLTFFMCVSFLQLMVGFMVETRYSLASIKRMFEISKCVQPANQADGK